MIDLGVAIMGCVERLENINKIMMHLANEGVPEDRVTLVLDEHKDGPWPTNQRAWRAADPAQTHHLVLQDDVGLPIDFYKGLIEVIRQRPEHLINLFCYSQKVVSAQVSWAISRGYLWAQGVLMPLGVRDEFLQWAEDNVNPGYRHDDAVMALWCLHTKRNMWITIPSLVEHLDGEYASLMKHWGKKRVAARFIGTASPLDIDWSCGVDYPVKVTSYSIGHFDKGGWRKNG